MTLFYNQLYQFGITEFDGRAELRKRFAALTIRSNFSNRVGGLPFLELYFRTS